MKKYIYTVMLILMAITVTQAQRMLPKQKGLEISSSVLCAGPKLRTLLFYRSFILLVPTSPFGVTERSNRAQKGGYRVKDSYWTLVHCWWWWWWCLELRGSQSVTQGRARAGRLAGRVWENDLLIRVNREIYYWWNWILICFNIIVVMKW